MPATNYYFSLGIKTNLKEFYDREKSMGILKKSVETAPLIIVYGLRRVGKTSLLNVTLNEMETQFIIIDARELYKEKSMVFEVDLLNLILKEFMRKAGYVKKFQMMLKNIVSRINGLSVHGVEITLDSRHPPSLTDLIFEIDSYSAKKEIRFVIVIDEAQYLRYSRTRFDMLLSQYCDRFKNITFILTGSEVGVLEKFVDADNPEKPLFGRVTVKILLNQFTNEESHGFLSAGFKQFGLLTDEDEIEKVIALLGGNVGWLTLYGYNRCVMQYSMTQSIENVIESASKLLISELDRVIERSRERYTAILYAISKGIMHWGDIKSYLIVSTGKDIDDKNFTKLLNRLIDYGFVYRKENLYRLTDALLSRAMDSLKASN